MGYTEEERKQKKKEYDEKYYEKNKEKIKTKVQKYYQEHFEKYIKRATKYNKSNKEKRREISKKSAENIRRVKGIQPRKKFNSEEERKEAKRERGKRKRKEFKEKNPNYNDVHKKNYMIKWHQNHIEHDKIYGRKYRKLKKQNDLNFRIACNLRGRLYQAVKNGYKTGSAVKDLGCSIPEFITYFESKFQEGMTWKNWCRNGWHIDHVIPLSSFNLSNRKEFLKAVHYTNLQPLWAKDNMKKSNKIK